MLSILKTQTQNELQL